MKRLLLLPLVALAACGPRPAPPVQDAAVTVTDAWCRPTPNGARAGACYAAFTAATDDRLTGGSSPRAAQLQIHEMSMAGGVMRMGEMKDGLPLPAGKTVTLAPGGNHIMLIGLTGPLVEGETAPLTLRFASASEVTVQAPVRAPSIDHAGH